MHDSSMIANPIPEEVAALRKELILSQIRLMELNDKSEAGKAEIARLLKQFKELQSLTDEKLLQLVQMREQVAQLELQLQKTRFDAIRADLSAKETEASLQVFIIEEKRIKAEQAEHITLISGKLEKIEKSLSWQMTKPFRSLYSLIVSAK